MATWVFSRPTGSFVGQEDTNLAVVSVPLPAPPTDIGNVSGLTISSTPGALFLVGWNNDEFGVECRIMDGATVLAAADAGGGWMPVQALTNQWGTPIAFPALTFSYVNPAAGLTEWDNAEIEYRQLYSKVQKTDLAYLVAAQGTNDVTVTYTATDVTGDASFTLGDLTSAGTVSADVAGDAALTLGDLTSTIRANIGSGVDSSITMGDVTVSSLGSVAVPGEATGDADITLGALTLSSAVLGDRTATSAITLGELVMSARTEVGGGTAVALIDDEQIAAAFGGGGGGGADETDGTAGEALTPGDVCYLSSNGKWLLADASAETTGSGMLGVCTETLALDQVGSFLLTGFRNESGLTTGDVLYLSTTAGQVTHTVPTGSGEVVRVVGYATTTTQYYFHPDKTWLGVA